MATKRKTGARRTVARKALPSAARSAAGTLRDTWSATLQTLTAAEADLQRQIGLLLKRNKIGAKDAGTMLADVRALVDRERRKALKQLESRLETVQGRIRKERRAAAKMVDQAVQSALATFNIPSRHEVAELTRKVDQLSKKIDSFRR
jgi:poly(hydroxyalkanoate) granule-associated protein